MTNDQTWTIWDDLGAVVSNFSEQEAREFLKINRQYTDLYAENLAGETIESWDGHKFAPS